MKSLIQVFVFHIAIQCCEIVKCSPHRPPKSFQKSFHFEISPIPLQHISFLLEKITPFRRYEFKHVIKKRQIAENENSPVSNEIPVNVGPIVEDIVKLQEDVTLQKDSEANLIPKIIITSVIKPVEDTLPVDSVEKIVSVEDVVKETMQPAAIIVQDQPEIKIEEVVPSSETIIEITPKPIDVLPPPPLEPQSPNVGIVPPLAQIPVFRNPNIPVISPAINTPPLFTDITKIPLIGLPNPTPVIPVPEYSVPPLLIPSSLSPLPPPPPPTLPALPSPPLLPPPPIKEEPPVVKEETPNFFVKGSRFVLYFGSMMLQMLSQLVNGHINLNHPIDIPILAGVQ